MCVVSMVIGDLRGPGWPVGPRHPWEEPTPYPWAPTGPVNPPSNPIPWADIVQNPDLAKQLLDVLERLEAIDKRMGTLERCAFSEPEKEAIKAALRDIAKPAKAAAKKRKRKTVK